ncbi:MAG: glycerophosphodiester phosphodiesterase [Hyphomicrobiaceae bacterium]|nr:glycerophosphodiester phosphodiesterase [Hyphomicrobiaceae bacterium]
MMERSQFCRPIAHRGLHGAPGGGAVENTLPAFSAAISRGYGLECDLRPGKGGLPLVFHDETLDRLVAGSGPVAQLGPDNLSHLAYKGDPAARIPTFAALCDLVSGRVPMLVEIKSEWGPIDRAFLAEVARIAGAYAGPLALMSFDPAVMTAIRALAPDVPRGIVSGDYMRTADDAEDHWWEDRLDRNRAERLTNLLESGPASPDFYAYDVRALPTPVTRYVREVQGLAMFTWTVRTAEDRATADQHADAPIFEGFLA